MLLVPEGQIKEPHYFMIWKALPCSFRYADNERVLGFGFSVAFFNTIPHTLFNHSKNAAIKNCRFTELLKKSICNLFLPQFYTMTPSQKDLMTHTWLQPLEPVWQNAEHPTLWRVHLPERKISNKIQILNPPCKSMVKCSHHATSE